MRPQPGAISRFIPFSYTIGVSIFGKMILKASKAYIYKPEMFPRTIHP